MQLQKQKGILMLKTYTILLASATLLFTACDSEKAINDIRNSNDSTEETIAKQDIVYIIKHTPDVVCQSDDFKNAVKAAIKTYEEEKGKGLTVKDIKTYVQDNSVTCKTYKPKDKLDVKDPICEVKEATDIQNYTLPNSIELNQEINTSCVVTGNII